MVIITTLITASGQSQSPAAIAKKWDEIRHLCEKYDDGADSAYRILNEQIASTKKDPVANAIWHSCLAQFLSDYYNSNRYRLGQRTEVADETPADFKEWDAKTFGRRVREEYVRSLTCTAETWPLLTGKPASDYKSLLKNARYVRPELTLYDMRGREVSRLTLRRGDKTVRLDLDGLPAGAYLLKLLTPHGLATRRLLVQ